ncbi:response regulator [Paraflavitalea pollutisoli]|uniref:response regulator n=1 Tax=Paraflavitalea pollutisoli TaxID=3034143 RepID=UPI0023EC7763|nr:response regulator [Paraflavitalea sp. H1-2-19X]
MVPKTILLAEDDADDREMFADFLASRADVALASLAEDGVDLLHTLNKISHAGTLPDFVILDQNMPRQNGLQTLKELKELPAYQHIPVFIYSTYADKTLEAQCIQAGALGVFTKPYSFDGYDVMIDDMLAQVEG